MLVDWVPFHRPMDVLTLAGVEPTNVGITYRAHTAQNARRESRRSRLLDLDARVGRHAAQLNMAACLFLAFSECSTCLYWWQWVHDHAACAPDWTARELAWAWMLADRHPDPRESESGTAT